MLQLRVWLVLVVIVCTSVSTLPAAPPAYLVLEAPAAPIPQRPSHSGHPGREIPVATQAYAYGWFGVQPRQHWSRHFGYYRNYTQWSAK